MSWNSLLEGFRRHEATTGQENPLHTLKRHNDEIRDSLTTGQFKDQLEEARRKNVAEAERIERMKAELLGRKQFYEENSPPQVRERTPEMFRSLEELDPRFRSQAGTGDGSRFQEIEDEDEN